LSLALSYKLRGKSFGEDHGRFDDLLVNVLRLSDDRWLKNLFIHNWLDFFENLSPFTFDHDGSLLNDFMEALDVCSSLKSTGTHISSSVNQWASLRSQ